MLSPNWFKISSFFLYTNSFALFFSMSDVYLAFFSSAISSVKALKLLLFFFSRGLFEQLCSATGVFIFSELLTSLFNPLLEITIYKEKLYILKLSTNLSHLCIGVFFIGIVLFGYFTPYFRKFIAWNTRVIILCRFSIRSCNLEIKVLLYHKIWYFNFFTTLSSK